LWAMSPFPTPPVELIEERLSPILANYPVEFIPDLPIQAVYAYLSGWTRLYGIVAMEVFGHLRWAVSDVEPLFELELAGFLGVAGRSVSAGRVRVATCRPRCSVSPAGGARPRSSWPGASMNCTSSSTRGAASARPTRPSKRWPSSS